MNNHLLVNQLLGQHRHDDLLDNLLAELVIADVFGVLCRNNHGVNPLRLAVVAILNGDLTFAIGPEPFGLAALPQSGKTVGQFVSQKNRQGQIGRGFLAGIPEHQALVAGALFLMQALAFGDTLRDVRALTAQGDQDRTVVCIKTDGGVVVSDFPDCLSYNIRNMHLCFRGDFAGYHCHTGSYERLAGHPAVGVLGQ